MIDLRFSESELEARRKNITSFIADTVDAAGADGAVLGLSGGVDSSLTASLAVEVLGAGSLYGLVLPATVSSEDNMSDAERVAEDLGIEYDVVEIDPIVGKLLDAYSDAEGDATAVGNSRARSTATPSATCTNSRCASSRARSASPKGSSRNRPPRSYGRTRPTRRR